MFIQEFYAVTENKQELLFELIERLNQNQNISLTLGLNVADKIEDGEFSLPMYSNKQLQEVISIERANYYKE